MPVDVVGVGQNAVDHVHVLPAWPEPVGARSKLRIRRRAVYCGGQTATAMVACARLGLRTRYIGAIGSDDNGRLVCQALAADGVDQSAVVVLDRPTNYATILVEEASGERIVLWERDERLVLGPDDLRAELLADARLVHVDDGHIPTAVHTARLARDLGLPVTSDIDGASDLTEDLLGLVTYPILAEHVPAALTGEADLERALRQLRHRFPQPLTVTLGARGAVALEGDRLIHRPAADVRAVDTTGAGDVFRAGFIHAVLQGAGMDETLRWANAAAGASCRRHGAMGGAPVLDEVRALLR